MTDLREAAAKLVRLLDHPGSLQQTSQAIDDVKAALAEDEPKPKGKAKT